jgi:hypothetical protein
VAAFLCAAFACAAPRVTGAQAPPGPMHPAEQHSAADDPTGYGDVSVRHSKPVRPTYKTDIAGVWKFNQNDSDDILEKLKEAREGSGGRDDGNSGNGQNSPRTNSGGIHMGGMGSPYPGGTGSGGGNNGAGNPRSKGANGSPSSELSINNPEIEEYTTPAGQLTFAMKDASEVDLTDDASRQRTYFTDDRRIAKVENQKPGDPKQFDAYWEDVKLVAKEDLPHSVRVTREFEVQPGGMELVEHVTIETNHSNGYVELHLSYDRVGALPAPPPPAPKAQTASAGANDGAPHPITSVSTANGAASSTSSDPNAPPATVPNATQSGPSGAPTLKRPSSPQ